MPDVDEAIGACLLSRGSTRSLRALAAVGEPALHRWIEVYHGRGRPFDRPARVRMSGREEVDVWSAMLGELAKAQPQAFTAAVVGGGFGRQAHTDTLILVCLKDIDDPRGTEVLIRGLATNDWLVRYHAVRGLAGRDSDEARAALVRALDDPEEMIRAEARQAMRRTP